MDSRKLADALIRHDLAARSLDKGEADKIVRLLNGMISDATKELAARHAVAQAKGLDRGPARTKFLTDAIEGYTELNQSIYARIAQGLETQLVDRAKAEEAFAARAGKTASADFGQSGFRPHDTNFLRNLVNTTPIAVDQHGAALLKPWVAGMADGDLRRFEATLRTGIGLGETTAQLVKRIEAGGWAKSRASAQTVALTANSAIANAARLETFRSMKSVAYVEWSAILDTRTSQICQSLSGKIWPIDSAHPVPPAHPRCRSILLPRRNHTDPPLHKPYREWLKGQDAKTQDEALGKKRGAQFRDGKLPDADLNAHDGTTKTAAELARHDDAIVEEKPFSPINPSTTDDTIELQTNREVKAELQAQATEAAKDPRYYPVSATKSIKPDDFGKVSLATSLTPEAVSLIAAIKPEIDAIADAFDVPRIRGWRNGAGSAVMNHGEGTLGINPAYVNGYAAKLGKGPSAVAAKAEKIKADLTSLQEKLTAKRSEYEAAGRLGDFYHDYADDFKAARDLADQHWKAKIKVRKADHVNEKPLSTWRVGDDPKARPFTIEQYFESSTDKMRSLLFHETGHLVHDYFNNAGGWIKPTITGRYTSTKPPARSEIEKRFLKVDRDKLASRYATKNGVEWWAEGFALYMMDRKDLVDPVLKELIEEMLNYAKNKR